MIEAETTIAVWPAEKVDKSLFGRPRVRHGYKVKVTCVSAREKRRNQEARGCEWYYSSGSPSPYEAWHASKRKAERAGRKVAAKWRIHYGITESGEPEVLK